MVNINRKAAKYFYQAWLDYDMVAFFIRQEVNTYLGYKRYNAQQKGKRGFYR